MGTPLPCGPIIVYKPFSVVIDLCVEISNDKFSVVAENAIQFILQLLIKPVFLAINADSVGVYTFACLVANLAVIILSLTGFHPVSALAAFLLSKIPTSWWWCFSLPEYSIVVCPLVMRPWSVHRTSLKPRMSNLYFCISFSTWSSRPHWNSVRTFHVPILVKSLALKIGLLWFRASRRLSLDPVMNTSPCVSPWASLTWFDAASWYTSWCTFSSLPVCTGMATSRHFCSWCLFTGWESCSHAQPSTQLNSTQWRRFTCAQKLTYS